MTLKWIAIVARVSYHKVSSW